jgi:hypothetical protein
MRKRQAERRAGELLAEMEQAKGGNPNLLHRATGAASSYAPNAAVTNSVSRYSVISCIFPWARRETTQ